jgi:hypothetical protein
MLYWTLSIALGVFDIRIFSCLQVNICYPKRRVGLHRKKFSVDINICTDAKPLKETDASLRKKSNPQGLCLARHGHTNQQTDKVNVVCAPSHLIR